MKILPITNFFFFRNSYLMSAWHWCLHLCPVGTTNKQSVSIAGDSSNLLQYSISHQGTANSHRTTWRLCRKILQYNNFHLFHLHLFKRFAPQLKYQAESDPIYTTILLRLNNQNSSLKTSSDKKTLMLKKKRKRSDFSLHTNWSWCPSNYKRSSGINFINTSRMFQQSWKLNEPSVTLFLSLKFDADCEIFTVKNDTLHIN